MKTHVIQTRTPHSNHGAVWDEWEVDSLPLPDDLVAKLREIWPEQVFIAAGHDRDELCPVCDEVIYYLTTEEEEQ